MVSDLLLASLDDCSDVLFERAVVSDWQQVPVLGPFISATLCSYAYVRTFIQGLEERLVNLEVGHGVWGLCLNLVAIYGFESGVVKPTDVKTSNDAGCRGKFPKAYTYMVRSFVVVRACTPRCVVWGNRQ